MSAPNTTDHAALVTGAGQGMGRGIALRLAADGHRVAIVDLSAADAQDTADLIRDAGGQAVGVQGDVTSRSSVTNAVESIASQLGTVDVLVNCAGWDALMPFLETDEALWERLLDINLKGPMRLAHAVLPGMVEKKWGRVINIGSDAGRVGSMQESVYSGAKGGLIAFTKTLAREFARHSITANTVCPGPTDTPGFREATSGAAEGVIASMAKGVPMRRLGTPDDVAAAVSFFARDDANYVTGQTLSVSGGLTMA
jgi:2-hydroxycyclohexanecarboxyl-CoA dehydrogenase